MNKRKSLSEGNSFAGKLGVLRVFFFPLFSSTGPWKCKYVLAFVVGMCPESKSKFGKAQEMKNPF